MAKYTNIIRIISKEIEKGNIYMNGKGNFISEEMVTTGIEESYVKALRNKEIPITTGFEDFKKEFTTGVISTTEVLSKIVAEFKLDNDNPTADTTKVSEPSEENVTQSEPSEEKKQSSEHSEPKKPKGKKEVITK